MRQQNTNNSNNSNRRPRGRSNNNNTNRKPQQSRNGVFDSNGPGGRIRGNASQLKEKYLQLARDATVSGDRVLAESLHQFAEHYFRVINDSTDPQTQSQPQSQSQNQSQSRHSSDQRQNQSDNYRNRNSRSNVDQENKGTDSTGTTENEIDSSAGTGNHSDVSSSEAAQTGSTLSVDNSSESNNEETGGRAPRNAAPRNRIRTRRPRYEAAEADGEQPRQNRQNTLAPEAQPIPEAPVVDAKPVAAELPLNIDEAAVEKPKRKPRTPKPKAETSEIKTPRPRGRPRKVVAKVEDDSSTETA